MTDIEDKSLLRCTIKKSADVLKKVILIVSVVIVLLLGLAIIAKGITVIWDFFWTDIHHWLDIVISIPILFLISIPWYVYVGAVAVLAIPVYSFLWCIARELTEEDYAFVKELGYIMLIFAGIVLLYILVITLPKFGAEVEQVITEQPLSESSITYGCPGCPNSFADFARDFCVSRNYDGSVSDGINTISCEEVRQMADGVK
jgi:hypothetical protein